jgi:dihydrofolate reductase
MKLVVQQFLTLDGVVQGPGGPDEDRSGGFEHGGWLAPYGDDRFGEMIVEALLQADAFLLGRKTYDIFAAFWPNVTDPDNPVAVALNTQPKYVVSTTLDTAAWNNTTLLKDDVTATLARLKREPGRELQVQGSADLTQTLMREGLVDAYRLYVAPVVLGSGKRLFPEGTAPAAMQLTDSEQTSTGLVANVYERTGKPAYGTIGE